MKLKQYKIETHSMTDTNDIQAGDWVFDGTAWYAVLNNDIDEIHVRISEYVTAIIESDKITAHSKTKPEEEPDEDWLDQSDFQIGGQDEYTGFCHASVRMKEKHGPRKDWIRRSEHEKIVRKYFEDYKIQNSAIADLQETERKLKEEIERLRGALCIIRGQARKRSYHNNSRLLERIEAKVNKTIGYGITTTEASDEEG